MATRGSTLVLGLLLALLPRAESTAWSQVRSDDASGYAAAAPTPTKTTAPAPPTRNSLPPRASVNYELSGEAYREEPSPSDRSVGERAVPHEIAHGGSSSILVRASASSPTPGAAKQVNYQFEPRPSRDPRAPQELGEVVPHDAEQPYDERLDEEEVWADEYAPAHARHGHRRWFHWFEPGHFILFRTSKNSPPHVGLGEPLEGTSWLNRPNSVSFFAGFLSGDELINDRVQQGSALFGGFRLGWDFDHYWGVEARAGWSSPDIRYEPPPPPGRVDGIFLCDASFLYYPWGDSAWRPYGLVGLGMARFNFTDNLGIVYDEYLLGVPLGAGLKYQYHPNLTFRAEFLDNIAVGGGGLASMNNLSFSLGMELRFGGKPRSYYPWQPAKYIW